MASVTKKLVDAKLVTPPNFIADNVHYETIMGSVAYGVSNDTSDCDVYGFCIPPKGILFPNIDGHIEGFDQNIPHFEVWQEHHIKFSDNKEYDMAVYNIVKYFRLCADGNPNMIDSLFTSADCVLHMTSVGNMVKENRKLFLSKKCFHTFKGYAYAQKSKIKSGANASSPKRQEYYAKYGYDVKFAYHIVRLLNECEQILVEGDLDLRRNNDQLKSIRNGEWTVDQIDSYFVEKQKHLEAINADTKAIPNLIRDKEIKELLLNCLEHHYGALDKVVARPDKEKQMIQKIRLVIDGKL